MARIVGDGFDDQKRAAVEAVQWEIAYVILENGFWCHDRHDFRARAQAIGAGTKIHFLDVPRDELWRRIHFQSRNPSSTYG
jgi:hypothetical protein